MWLVTASWGCPTGRCLWMLKCCHGERVGERKASMIVPSLLRFCISVWLVIESDAFISRSMQARTSCCYKYRRIDTVELHENPQQTAYALTTSDAKETHECVRELRGKTLLSSPGLGARYRAAQCQHLHRCGSHRCSKTPGKEHVNQMVVELAAAARAQCQAAGLP